MYQTAGKLTSRNGEDVGFRYGFWFAFKPTSKERIPGYFKLRDKVWFTCKLSLNAFLLVIGLIYILFIESWNPTTNSECSGHKPSLRKHITLLPWFTVKISQKPIARIHRIYLPWKNGLPPPPPYSCLRIATITFLACYSNNLINC